MRSHRKLLFPRLVPSPLVAWFICWLALPALLFTAPVPANKPAHYPAWWFGRDVITRLNPADPNPTWPMGSKSADDYGVCNIGQAKHIASKARDEFNAVLPGGAGAAINQMVDRWSQAPAPGSPPRDDFSGIALGQLKTVAKPFYDRLIQLRYASGYPWTATTADDDSFAMGNIGQVKMLFSFDPRRDSDGDDLPDMWEMAAAGSLAMTAEGDLDGDGLDNALEFQYGTHAGLQDSDGDGVNDYHEIFHAGTDPKNFYNGVDPEAPENVLANRIEGDSKVSVTWTNSAQGIVEFLIERTNDGQNWLPIGRVGGSVREFIDSAPQPGVIHFYGVTANR